MDPRKLYVQLRLLWKYDNNWNKLPKDIFKVICEKLFVAHSTIIIEFYVFMVDPRGRKTIDPNQHIDVLYSDRIIQMLVPSDGFFIHKRVFTKTINTSINMENNFITWIHYHILF